MKKYAKTMAASLAIIMALSVPTVSYAADSAEIASKEEVVYGNLDATGKINNIYVVNIFNVKKEGTITDYGNYAAVKNLVNTNAIAQNGEAVTVTAPVGNFYYQGDMAKKDLPWNFNIAYSLDSKSIAPKDLSGKSGHLEIKIITEPNKNIEASFYENYLLQVAATLDTKKCSNIVAKDATLANAGENKMITFTVMPSKNGNLAISADVTNFSMDGIQFSAVPFAMNMELPDTSSMTKDLTKLSDGIKDLNDGVLKLKDGSAELSTGMVSLKQGTADFQVGLAKLSSNSGQLVSGSKEISNALDLMAKSLKSNNTSDLASLNQLPAGLGQFSAGLKEISKGLTALNTGFSSALAALEGAVSTIPKNEIAEKDLMALLMSNPNDKTLNQLVENYKAARTIKGTYTAVAPAFTAVVTNIGTMSGSIDTITASLDGLSKQLEGSLKKADIASSMAQLTQGISALATNYSTFHKGLVSYTEGVAQLTTGHEQLNTGVAKISDGTGELSKGIAALYDGTDELNSQTKDMPQKMDAQINDLMSSYDKSSYVPSSFVSSKNSTHAIQFVVKTEKILAPKVEKAVETTTKDTSFWGKLKDLFN